MSAPINVRMGQRQPHLRHPRPKSSAENRRIENRVPGVDVNPYLAMAATLACGYLGLMERTQPTEPMSHSAWDHDYELPSHMEDALARMRGCEALSTVLWPEFMTPFAP